MEITYSPLFSSNDASLRKAATAGNWLGIRNALVATSYGNSSVEIDGYGVNWAIQRIYLYYNTSNLGDKEVLSGKVELDWYVGGLPEGATHNIVLALCTDTDNTIELDDFGDIDFSTPLSDVVNLTAPVNVTMTLNTAGLAAINKNSITRLCLLQYTYDFLGNVPPNTSPPENFLYSFEAYPLVLLVAEQARPHGIRHVYRPGSYRAELTVGGVTGTPDDLMMELTRPTPEDTKIELAEALKSMAIMGTIPGGIKFATDTFRKQLK